MKQKGYWAAAALLVIGVAHAAGPDADAYARAARLLAPAVNALVDGQAEQLRWLDDGHVVYRTREAGGLRFIKVDAASGTRAPAFNHARLARLLAKPGQPVDPAQLPITRLTWLADGEIGISGELGRQRCRLSGQQRCVEWPEPVPRVPGISSPDGRFEVLIRDWNLWLREIATGEETALTSDGLPDHGYATDNAGWRRSDAPIVVWSPDSGKIATFRQDQRQIGEMVLVEPKIGRPAVQRWKYSMPGDAQVPMIERVVIDVATRTITRLNMAPDQRRSTLCDDISCHGGWEDVQWSADSRQLAFVSVNRDSTEVRLRIADAASGEVREVFSERTTTWFESGISQVSWRYLSASDEILWYSQRSDWGHLYLYDATSGALKRALTRGEWNVAEVIHVDPEQRRLLLIGVGREPGRNPYYRHLYALSLDGAEPTGEPTLLTPEDADHAITLSPDARWFVDRHSTLSTAPVTLLRNRDGQLITELERADLTRLYAAGWTPPEPFTVKARDGQTDLYGQLFKPSDFDPNRRYPVVLYLYPGPQTGSIRSHGFLAAHGDNQALAELGFIVVALDGMGTPWRSKSFHAAWAGDVADNTLPDQVAGLRELGARHAWMDLQRVGIWGHSGGGNATAAAMFRYPELFKVGVSQAGNHDNRGYADAWAEKWQGLEVIDAKGRSNYDSQANQNFADQLQGKLLLVHGGLDDNVPPYATLLVVDALNRANKDYDLIWLPASRHGYGSGQLGHYVIRRRWDYFVRGLLGVEPPQGVDLTPVP